MPPRSKVFTPTRPLRVRAPAGSRATTDHARLQHLTHEVGQLRCELQCLSDWLKSPAGPVLKSDLIKLEKKVMAKVSEIKKIVADAAAKSTEAFTEISTRLADLQKQIDDLIAGNGDPEVTDEEFTANLTKLKETTDSLADLVPNQAE